MPCEIIARGPQHGLLQCEATFKLHSTEDAVAAPTRRGSRVTGRIRSTLALDLGRRKPRANKHTSCSHALAQRCKGSSIPEQSLGVEGKAKQIVAAEQRPEGLQRPPCPDVARGPHAPATRVHRVDMGVTPPL